MAVKQKGKKDGNTSAEKKESVFEEVSHEEVASATETEEDKGASEVEDITDEEPVMTVSAVEEMLERQEKKWSDRLDSITQKFKFGKSKDEMDDGAAYIADLEDDWLESPVVFFAYSFEFSIHGDKKMGKASTPPQGVVKFKPVIRTKRSRGKSEEVISVSSVKVHSKALVEYLRNHSQFGIAFFENMDSVLNMNTDWAQRLIEANSAIQRLSDQQIIARCRQEDIPIGTDISKMRKALVEKQAFKSIKNQENLMYGKLQKASIEKGTDREIVERTVSQ